MIANVKNPPPPTLAAARQKCFLICNAHLDPVWLWTWEEGLTEAISTFRVAADFCDQYPDFVFNHNESILYEWVERGKIPAYKLGRVWRFSRREIDDFVRKKSLYNAERPLSSALGLGGKDG